MHVAGAGRTDAGVHAAAQVASIRLTATIAADRLVRAFNATLPPDVRVLAAEEIFDRFHARLHARGKTYRYFIWHAPMDHPALRRVAWHVPQRLSLAGDGRGRRGLRRRARLRRLPGPGQPACDRPCGAWPAPPSTPTPRCPAGAAAVDERGRLLCVEVSGSGFLRHMVRAMAGTIVQVGKGRMRHDDVVAALARRHRAAAGPTAPAHGLHLWRVHYM